ncbi:MAG: DinB family protein, partial [Chloroflexota bacterium]
MMEKSELLAWLQEEHGQWRAFLEEIDPERMEEPGVCGHWSIKDVIAHLTGWQHWLVARVQAVQQGEAAPAPPWPAQLEEDDDVNAWIYEAYRGRSVDDVLDETEEVLQEYYAVIESLPD